MQAIALPIEAIRDEGRKTMANSSVAICGLARDCAVNLGTLIPQVERLGSAFRSHRIIVVENDSKDDTGPVIGSWSRQNECVLPIRFCYRDMSDTRRVENSSVPGTAWFGRERMRRMAFARNQYLDALGGEALPDFLIVIDLDIKSFSLAGVEHSFGLHEAWDIATANGSRYSIRNPLRGSVYWDSYAYEPHEGFDDDVQTPRQIRTEQVRVAKLLKSGQLLPARSAFGGLGIYCAELLRDHRYSVVRNDHAAVPVLCDHPTLHRSIRQQHEGLRLLINPLMRVNYGSALQLLQQAFARRFKN